MNYTPDLLVVGAGLIGLGIAWRCAQKGLRVATVDPDPGRGASRVGAGLLLQAGGRISRRHLALRQASLESYPAFVEELRAETGRHITFSQRGMLTVAMGRTALESLEGLAGCLRGLGVENELLDADECRRREPALSDQVGAGLYTPDAQVDPEELQLALRTACLARGVSMLEARVVAVESNVARTSEGEVLEAGQVLVAAGCWSGQLLPELGVFPVKGEVIHLRGAADLLTANLQWQQQDLYVANRGDGRLVIGASEEEVGFDLRPTAGAVSRLLRQAVELVPALADFELVETRAGLRPKVADGLPVLGRMSNGVVVASGHYRNGILLTPVTAASMAELVVSGHTEPVIEPFRPR
ncbi:MAG: glycine oxidase ThiO [Candidatus Eremiobacteraeota bacterium]|nr:glycine oxidase ThiO [Candidatus Eremiobacteraeota bacterium]